MASGRALWLALILLSAWIAVLVRTWWKLLKHVRQHRPASRRVYLNLTGVGVSTLAVGALLCMHLSWVSAGISQYLGIGFISFLSALVIVPAFVGFYYSRQGSLRPLRITGWGAGGMIWGNETGWQQTEHGEKPKWAVERFYVGTEAQFRRNEARPADIPPTR